MHLNLNQALLVITVLLCNSFKAAEGCKGCVTLDEISFAKIVPRFKHALVKYDIAYPYGAKHDAFVKFAEELVTVRDLIVAEVGIKDYGDKDNEQFALEQGVDPKNLPKVILYTRSSNNKQQQTNQQNVVSLSNVTFTGDDFDVDKLRSFVVENAKVRITLPGCLDSFDELAERFAAEPEARDNLIKQAELLARKTAENGGGDGKNKEEEDVAKVYVTYMKKIQSDGWRFVHNERERLRRIIDQGKLADTKKKQLQVKLNVLISFDNNSNDSDDGDEHSAPSVDSHGEL